MSDTRSWVREILTEAEYAVGQMDGQDGEIILFESDSVLGFLLVFHDPDTLISDWHASSARALLANQFALRRAENKAWNAYFLLLAEAPGDYGQNITLGAIEEDLVGTRKIARAGIMTKEDCRAALLPLLPVQNAPRLEAIDMAAEIRLRTSELPESLVDAYLAGAAETLMTQLLESGSQ